MTMQNYFILTEAERDTAVGFSAPATSVNPRAVDNASPGAGINLNDAAENYAAGDPVMLTGAFVAPKRIVDTQTYLQNCPDLIPFLLTLPWATLEDETIFAPYTGP